MLLREDLYFTCAWHVTLTSLLLTRQNKTMELYEWFTCF